MILKWTDESETEHTVWISLAIIPGSLLGFGGYAVQFQIQSSQYSYTTSAELAALLGIEPNVWFRTSGDGPQFIDTTTNIFPFDDMPIATVVEVHEQLNALNKIISTNLTQVVDKNLIQLSENDVLTGTGISVKTVNGESIFGDGDIEISSKLEPGLDGQLLTTVEEDGEKHVEWKTIKITDVVANPEDTGEEVEVLDNISIDNIVYTIPHGSDVTEAWVQEQIDAKIDPLTTQINELIQENIRLKELVNLLLEAHDLDEEKFDLEPREL